LVFLNEGLVVVVALIIIENHLTAYLAKLNVSLSGERSCAYYQ
jgi:hypothetical protein